MDLSMAGSKRRSGGESDDVVDLHLSPAKRANLDEKQEGGGGKGKESLNGSKEGTTTTTTTTPGGGEGAQKLKDLSGFTFGSVLSNSSDSKRIVVEGKFRDGEAAVIVLDKKPFTEQNFGELFSGMSKLSLNFQNDIYGNYECAPDEKSAGIQATVIYPATPKHIEKYKFQEAFLVEETAELYEKVTLPYIESTQFSIQWVFNILEHKKEADRIVFEDPNEKSGFILLPDLKWDGKTLENLYVSAIVHPKGIKSLRDLTAEHLPLLKNILESGTNAIKEKYGLKRSQLRIFLHYQPSYYHLHVHFTHLNYFPPGINAEKSHLLPTVISNIEVKPSYYQEVTLPFVLKKNDPLYSKLIDFGHQF